MKKKITCKVIQSRPLECSQENCDVTKGIHRDNGEAKVYKAVGRFVSAYQVNLGLNTYQVDLYA